MAEKKRLLLIDGNSVAFRAFFSMHNQIGRSHGLNYSNLNESRIPG